MSLADQVALMEAEVAHLRRETFRLTVEAKAAERERAEEIRRVYRRGSRAGWGAKKHGRTCETAPERHARTDIREALSS